VGINAGLPGVFQGSAKAGVSGPAFAR